MTPAVRASLAEGGAGRGATHHYRVERTATGKEGEGLGTNAAVVWLSALLPDSQPKGLSHGRWSGCWALSWMCAWKPCPPFSTRELTGGRVGAGPESIRSAAGATVISDQTGGV